MTIAFDATSTAGYQTAQSTYSWSHTCTGSNRYLVVGVSMLSVLGSLVNNITYNGVSLTPLTTVSSVSGAVRVELWGLAAPATGSNTIAVTLSAALDSVGSAVSMTGVHQTLGPEFTATATATNGVGAADATVNVSASDNGWAIDVVATDDTAITVGAGQTSRQNATGTLGSGAMSTEGPQTPPGSITMSWTNVAGLATWSIATVGLKDVSDPNLRITQEPVRTLIAPTDANLRVTQEPVRTLIAPSDAKLRVTQEPVRTLIVPTDANLRVTQLAIRVLRLNDPGGGLQKRRPPRTVHKEPRDAFVW